MLPSQVIKILSAELDSKKLQLLIQGICEDTQLPRTTKTALELVVWLNDQLVIRLDKHDVQYLVDRTLSISPQASNQLKKLMPDLGGQPGTAKKTINYQECRRELDDTLRVDAVENTWRPECDPDVPRRKRDASPKRQNRS